MFLFWLILMYIILLLQIYDFLISILLNIQAWEDEVLHILMCLMLLSWEHRHQHGPTRLFHFRSTNIQYSVYQIRLAIIYSKQQVIICSNYMILINLPNPQIALVNIWNQYIFQYHCHFQKFHSLSDPKVVKSVHFNQKILGFAVLN